MVCSQLYFRYTIFVILLPLTGTANFTWIKFHDVFDGAVIVTVDGEPHVTGAMVNHDVFMTTANSIERITDVSRVNGYVIYGNYLKSIRVTVYAITRDFFKRNSKYWLTIGFDKRHCPIFDVVLVSIHRRFNTHYPEYRTPRSMRPVRHRIYNPPEQLNRQEKISFASFGFIDEAHLNNSQDLDMAEYLVGDVVVDCDEWIPRAWGHFICLLNVEKFLCNGAGAPLMYQERMIGLGAFSVKKGNESILVFTDTRRYNPMFYISKFYENPKIN